MATLRRHVSAILIVAAIVIAFAAGYVVAAQTHMENARGDLQRARNQLNAAIPDKAGHRVNALGLVDQALTQVNEGIAAGAR